jgi:FMN phosphatase YigB (HAD superfamily)
MIVVFDLDGTLCDNARREHLAHKAHLANGAEAQKIWDEFHEHIPLDYPVRPVLNTLYALAEAHRVEIWTARPEKYRQVTTEWLEKLDIYPDDILMRKTNDYRKSYIVKLEWYLQRPKTERPHLVFEDHPETTRLLRLAGAVVAQVGEGHNV